MASRRVSITSHHEALAGLNAGRYCDFGGVNFADEKVVECQEGERLTMRIVNNYLSMESADIRFTLQEKNGGTQVKLLPSTSSSMVF